MALLINLLSWIFELGSNFFNLIKILTLVIFWLNLWFLVSLWNNLLFEIIVFVLDLFFVFLIILWLVFVYSSLWILWSKIFRFKKILIILILLHCFDLFRFQIFDLFIFNRCVYILITFYLTLKEIIILLLILLLLDLFCVFCIFFSFLCLFHW